LSDKLLPAHFLMGPSSSSRWLECPGSLRVPHPEDEAGEAAAIGTLGHLLVEKGLIFETPCRINKPLEQSDREFLESLPDEVRDQLEEDVDLCVELVDGLAYNQRHLERQIQHDLIEEHGGTVDVIIQHGETLHVIDFKFGRMRVDPEGNPQIMSYINLARQLYPKATRFLGSIIQPKIKRDIQTVEFTLEELDEHERRVLEASISDEFKAGDHCQWCPLLHQCTTAAKHIRDNVEEFPVLTPEVDTETLVKIYKIGKLAEKMTKDSGAVLKERLRKGETVEGVGLRPSGWFVWKANAAEILTEAGVDFDCLVEAKMMSPSASRKKLGIPKDSFDEKFGPAISRRPGVSIVLGKNQLGEFPEFPDE